jgi:DNA-binding transcriptional LysR family regulator
MPRPSSLSFDLLATFLSLARHEGDTARVIDELGINQPSLSKRLAYLQHAGPILRRPWIERTGKAWSVTAEGQRMLPAVKEIVYRYRLLLDAVEEKDRPDLVFACGQTLVTGLVREALLAMRQRKPDLRYRISTPRGSVRIDGVANGSLDLAVVSHGEADIVKIAHRPLYIETLLDDPLCLAAVPGCSEYAAFTQLSDKRSAIKTLARLPLILPERDSAVRVDFDRRLREAGVSERLEVALELGGWTAALSAVLDGLGVGLLPRSVAARLQPAGSVAIRPVPGGLAPEHVYRIIARTRPHSDQLDLFVVGLQWLEVLRSAAEKWR